MYYVYMDINTGIDHKVCLEFVCGPFKTIEEAKQGIRDSSARCFSPDSGAAIGVPMEDWGGEHYILKVVGKYVPVPTLSVDVKLKKVKEEI